jgi:hypothetical protein
MTWRAAIPLAAFAVAGCSWGEAPVPRLDGVAPAKVLRGVKTIVSVTGDGFGADADFVDFDDSDGGSVCSDLQVQVRYPTRPSVTLVDAMVVGRNEIRGLLVGDLQPGDWDVAVVAGPGREAVLPAALRIENCAGSNVPCDDHDDCTFDAVFDPMDRCTGSSRCEGVSSRPDDSPCAFACTDGETVAGSCTAGVCVTGPGSCDPPPVCSP